MMTGATKQQSIKDRKAVLPMKGCRLPCLVDISVEPCAQAAIQS